ncbi:ATP-binding protein [Lentzea kentuckyensis]|uniref:ATP-binding protein n=1 Tax=Lentzea kentuckyensis TaxID=360086 RepID=UPI001179BE0E|nr:ATP-binding protein [Lentzea kentuckyensis]
MNETGNFDIHIQGHAYSSVVAGHHNLVIDARHGSVTLEAAQERPQPVRRESVSVLPRQSRAPIGRDTEIAALAADIAAGGLVQLCGRGGVGKSTLLRHLARTVPGGPDGTVFVSRAHHEAGDLAQEIFEACYETWGYAPSTADLRGFMTGVRVTVYLDDADLEADQLRRLADLIPDATFVLASREATLLGDSAVHDLRGLGQDAAALLMSEALGRSLTDTDQAAVAALWQASDGNPLLLVRAAGLARSASPGPGGAEIPQPGAVPHLIPSLLTGLDNRTKTVLALLAVLGDAELAPDHIRDLTGESGTDEACVRLTGLGLAVQGEDGYHCAPGVIPAMRDHGTSVVRIDWLCQYFTSWASDPATDPARVARHSRVFERLAGLATTTGQPDLAVALGRAVSPALSRSLRFDSWGRILGRGWTAARRSGDREAEAYFAREESFRAKVIGRRVIAAALAAYAIALAKSAAHTGSTALPPDSSEALGEPGLGTAPEPPGDPGQIDDHMSALDDIPGLSTNDFPEPSYLDVSFQPDAISQAPVPDSGPHDVDVSAIDPSAGTSGLSGTSSAAQATASTASGTAATVGATAAAGTAAAGAGLLPLLLLVVIAAIVTVVVNQKDETGIVGTWNADDGNTYVVRKSGTGSYSTPSECGADVRLTGTDTYASGTFPIREEGYSCGAVIGQGRLSLKASADGKTLTWTPTTLSSPEGSKCTAGCRTLHMRRAS